MNFPYQILEFELESLFYKGRDEKLRRGKPTVLASVLDSMIPLSLSAMNVDVNDVLPPNGAQILV